MCLKTGTTFIANSMIEEIQMHTTFDHTIIRIVTTGKTMNKKINNGRRKKWKTRHNNLDIKNKSTVKHYYYPRHLFVRP